MLPQLGSALTGPGHVHQGRGGLERLTPTPRVGARLSCPALSLGLRIPGLYLEAVLGHCLSPKSQLSSLMLRPPGPCSQLCLGLLAAF